MNKAQFVELVQKSGGYKTKVEAEAAITAFTGAVSDALAAGDEISLIGFGKFSAVLQKGKTGPIPGKAGQTYTTVDKMIPKFYAGDRLKTATAGK